MHNHWTRTPAALAGTCLAAQAAAQTPTAPASIEACYVPASGTVYRIDTPQSPAPGAPKQCLTAAHARFGWSRIPTLGSGAFDLSNAAGFAAVGGGGGSPALAVGGAGTRMFWYPLKSALRAGRANGAEWDDANVGPSSVAFGFGTLASGIAAAAVGSGAQATGLAAVALGNGSIASGQGSLAAGGSTRASGDFAVALGASTQATGSAAVALGSGSVAGGANALAAGRQSFATGDNAVALGNGVLAAAGGVALGNGAFAGAGGFAFADASTTTPFGNLPNAFLVRATGGVHFVSATGPGTGNVGVVLSPGSGSWQSLSDARRKTAFRDVNGEALLGRLATLPVRTWQYRAQSAAVRHIGPTAQDFRRAFAVGESDTTITAVDGDGVALAAAKALERRTATLRREVVALRAANDTLRRRLAAIERTLYSVGAVARR